jgi:hypothetical protein
MQKRFHIIYINLKICLREKLQDCITTKVFLEIRNIQTLYKKLARIANYMHKLYFYNVDIKKKKEECNT